MAITQEQLALAQKVHDQITAFLSGMKVQIYSDDFKDDMHLMKCKITGDDLTMQLNIVVRADQQVAAVYSPMPFDVPEDKRLEMAVAITAVNYGLYEGSFDYDIKTGNIVFRLSNCFKGGAFNETLPEHMIFRSLRIVDHYNDKLLVLANGTITLERFLEVMDN